MSNGQPPQKEEVDSRVTAGPYDFAIFIARSLGRSLPAVVVLGLIAFGAVYGIREMTQLQTRLNQAEKLAAQAEIKKTRAEAEAREAGDKARYQALQDYSKQLRELNAISADVSERLQKLVSSQIANMIKANELSEAQDAKARKLQEQVSHQSEAELANLRGQIEEAKSQITETQTKYAESVRAAGLSSYNDVKTNIAAQLSKGYSIDPILLDFLKQKLDDPVVRTQAITDAKDTGQNLDMRLVLYIQLFRNTSQTLYLESGRSLADGNKRLVGPVISSLFGRNVSFSDQQVSALLPVVAGFIFDAGYISGFRDNLLEFLGHAKSSQIEALDPHLAEKLAQYAGKRLIENAQKSTGYCFELYQFSSILKLISSEAELVYATQSLQHPGGRDDREKQCIKDELEKSISGRHPTKDAMERWLGLPTTSAPDKDN